MYCTQWTWFQDLSLALKVKVSLSRGNYEVVIYSWTNVKPSFYCEKNQESKYKYELTPGSFARILWLWTRSTYQILWLRVCILVFVIGYAMRIYSASYCIVIFGLSAVPYFSTWELKDIIFGGKNLLNIKFILIFSTNFAWKISNLRIIQRDFLCKILIKLKFSWQIFEKKKQSQYQIKWKSV
jgi:hypothetical protein